MSKIKNVTATILAGGKSMRMGKDKTFLPLGNIFLLNRMFNIVEAMFKNIIVISNQIEQGDWQKCPVFKDIIPDKGPMGGIHSALNNISTSKTFIIAIDTPFISERIIRNIIAVKDFDVVATKYHNEVNPLPLMISKNCLDTIHKNISTNHEQTKNRSYSLRRFFEEFNTMLIDLAQDENDSLFNINTIDDFQRAESILKEIEETND